MSNVWNDMAGRCWKSIPFRRLFAGFAGDLLYLAHFSEAGDKSVGLFSVERDFRVVFRLEV